MCRHILILEVNNVLTDLGSRHPSVMQDQVPFLQVSVLKDGKMFFMPFFFSFLLWKLRHREDVRAIQIHQQSHGYTTFQFTLVSFPLQLCQAKATWV